MYEEFIHGSLDEVVKHFEAKDGRGEMVVMIGAGEHQDADDTMIMDALNQAQTQGLSASASAKQVAKALDVSRSRVYDLIHPKTEEK